MMCAGGFTVNNSHSFYDMGFTLAERMLSAPVKKSARVSIPFSSKSYDFSDVYGKLFFEDRQLTYVFDLIALTPVDLELEVTKLTEFVSFVQENDIYDDDTPYYHFTGSFSSLEIERDESGLGATATVVFNVYPFKVSNDECEARLEVGENIVTNNGYTARITVVPDSTMTIVIGSLKQTFNGETQADIALERGENTITVSSGGGVIRWREERF